MQELEEPRGGPLDAVKRRAAREKNARQESGTGLR